MIFGKLIIFTELYILVFSLFVSFSFRYVRETQKVMKFIFLQVVTDVSLILFLFTYMKIILSCTLAQYTMKCMLTFYGASPQRVNLNWETTTAIHCSRSPGAF